jgi:UDP-N-acetylglucosamine 2-epimerase (non-hydrolysing)
MKILLVAGARPNFMKIAPIYRSSCKFKTVQCQLVHTGQHYDYEMSEAFFKDLEIPRPDYFLNSGSGTHATQTAKIMVEFESLCQNQRPDAVILVGDVNSTLACSIVAKKMMIKVIHVEAGLRSQDFSMPEEINRVVTDSITDLYFVTEESGVQNLINEGKPKEHIFFVGNVMIDNLFHQVKKLDDNNDIYFSTSEFKLKHKKYAFLTLHRPSNVDSKEDFHEISDALNHIADRYPIIFPVHPRTRKMIDKFHVRFSDNIKMVNPLAFQEALYLWKDATFVLTDSGGLQEETTALGVPCITLRENTERPVTLSYGCNILGGTKKDSIIKAFHKTLLKTTNPKKIPPKWDGKSSDRIWSIILNECQ